MTEKKPSSLANDPESVSYKKPPQYFFEWQKDEGIPIHETFYMEDLGKAELAPWDRFGGNGCFVNLTDSFLMGSFVLEIPPGKSLKKIHHMFEGTVYVVSGRGETVIEQKGCDPQTIEWQERSLFAPPLNTTYQHRNLDPDQPARLLVVNNAPLVLSLYHDEDFVFGNDHAFTKRYKGEETFFDGVPEYLGSRLSRVNYIQDLSEYELYNWELRGKGARTAFMSVSDNTIAAHVSSFEVGTYKKAHRHGAGAHVVMLDGEGYSLLWKDGEPRKRVEWHAGTMFAPPEWAWHQHFNTGDKPARYLAIRNNNPEHPVRMGLPGFRHIVDGKTQFGETQIEFDQEDPVIYAEYAAELAKKGVKIRQEMPGKTQN
ncbi:MAG: cupin domain-containing protein [Rhodospirillales bacterium]|nr:cupin domain-containing protein [Rhodospirillales bacterium]MBT4007288.1 cupin domain-containing protein [Rhodospirillales bacterium]MBT5077007.1 cupin domain-containing protein [Rhodospirillales bacterium]MBT5113621.1 cupin domain-containing protein [Rhodospirillales bacterium]MBT5673919.1 cupin domain-containing protein [Rhodospirillales bacterium]